ncbi:Uncharacterised protein [uncultured archaeon]|nr:Uncharacterised protein [uncultured archaeon]
MTAFWKKETKTVQEQKDEKPKPIAKGLNIEKQLPLTERLVLDKRKADRIDSGQKEKLRERAFNVARLSYAGHLMYRYIFRPETILKEYGASPEEIAEIKWFATRVLINKLDGEEARKLADETGGLEEAIREARGRLAAFDAGTADRCDIDDAIATANAFGLKEEAKKLCRNYLDANEAKEVDYAVHLLEGENDWHTLTNHYAGLVRFAKSCGLGMSKQSKDKIRPYVSGAVIDYCFWKHCEKGGFKRMLTEDLGFDEQEALEIAAKIKANLLAILKSYEGKNLSKVLGSSRRHSLTKSAIRFFGDYGTEDELEKAFRLLIRDRDDTYYFMPLLIAEYGMVRQLSDLGPSLGAGLDKMLDTPTEYGDDPHYYKALKDYEAAGLIDPTRARNALIRVIESKLNDGKIDEAVKLAFDFDMPKEAEKISEIRGLLGEKPSEKT